MITLHLNLYEKESFFISLYKLIGGVLYSFDCHPYHRALARVYFVI